MIAVSSVIMSYLMSVQIQTEDDWAMQVNQRMEELKFAFLRHLVWKKTPKER